MFTSAIEHVFQIYNDKQEGYREIVKLALPKLTKDLEILSEVADKVKENKSQESNKRQKELEAVLVQVGIYEKELSKAEIEYHRISGEIERIKVDIENLKRRIENEEREIQNLHRELAELEAQRPNAWYYWIVPIVGLSMTIVNAISNLEGRIQDKVNELTSNYKELKSYEHRLAVSDNAIKNAEISLSTTNKQIRYATIQRIVLEKLQLEIASSVAYAMDSKFFYEILRDIITGISDNMDRISTIEVAMEKYYGEVEKTKIKLKDALFILADDFEKLPPFTLKIEVKTSNRYIKIEKVEKTIRKTIDEVHTESENHNLVEEIDKMLHEFKIEKYAIVTIPEYHIMHMPFSFHDANNLAKEGFEHIVIDMRAVTIVGSGVLDGFKSFRHSSNTPKPIIHFCGLHNAWSRLFNCGSGLELNEEDYKIYYDQNDAIEAFNNPKVEQSRA
ncbi:hypothetical protein GOQ04_22500 [Emticicia sp. ODNR4P]|nr:hypothetical protein [Emticicia sp. ODNR4P]